MIILYPVVTRVPETIKILRSSREKVEALSLFARESVKTSGTISHLPVSTLEKNARGVPIPSNHIFWSVAHKPDFVAGVVSIGRIGIDLEQIKDVSDGLFERVVDPQERACFLCEDKKRIFFRAFTAKEAVLKKTGHGIQGLSKAKIRCVVDDKNLQVQYLDKKYAVEHFYFDDYLASVTKDKTDVQWTITLH